MEKWKDIVGFEPYYEVSDTGKIRSKKRVLKRASVWDYTVKSKILKTCITGAGYQMAILSVNGKNHPMHIHKAVAMAFLNHTPERGKIVIDHIDHNRLNNNLTNLQVITTSENLKRSPKCGSNQFGKKHRKKVE